MELILNAGIGIGFLMFLLLLFKKNKTGGDYFFLFFVLAILLQICFYQTTIFLFDLKGLPALVGFAIPLISSPLLFLYILSLTGQKVTWSLVLAHLGIYFLYIILVLLFKEDMELIASNGFLELPVNSPAIMYYYAVPMAISGLVYSIWDLFLLKNHQNRISQLFSSHEKINLNWVRYLVYSFFVIFIVTSFVIFGATNFQIFRLDSAFALVGIALSLFLIAFGFYGLKQTTVFSNIGYDIPEIKVKAYSKSGLTKEKISEGAVKIEKIMTSEKLFLDDELTLNLLSEKCEIPSSHISQIINQHFRMNFYDFVNRYRINEAKKMLLSTEYDKLSVLGIAYDCGFKSKSSFNRYFKKFCAETPSEFKKNQVK